MTTVQELIAHLQKFPPDMRVMQYEPADCEAGTYVDLDLGNVFSMTRTNDTKVCCIDLDG